MSVPAVLFAPLADLVADRLGALLAASGQAVARGVSVATTVPTARPQKLVTVRRDGGARRDLSLEDARLGINVWAPDESAVDALTALVRALVATLADGAPVCRVREASGPVDVSAASAQARRYFTVEVAVRGAQL